MRNHALFTFAAASAVAVVCAIGPIAHGETVVTESTGTVSEFSPDALVIHSETATAPTRYVVGRDVEYVDEAGAPVSVDIVKRDLPVSISYVREGDRMIVRRVIVHRHVTPAPVVEERRVIETRPVIEEKRVIEQRPAIEEHRTTTTTTINER